MFEPKSLVYKATRRFFAPASGKQEQQRRLMATALTLLVAALVFVLYHNRDFWFPDAQDADDEILQPVPAGTSFSSPAAAAKPTTHKRASGKAQLTASAEPVSSTPPIVATTTRTVLPPLEVEVVAGDTHQKLHPANSAVQLDVQPNSADQSSDSPQENKDVRAEDKQADNAASASVDETAARVTDKASERVEMSPGTSEMVSASVKPGYPMLARQMKVQRFLAAVLHLLELEHHRIDHAADVGGLRGRRLFAAAREAVKQWHFKPHYEGSQAVETVARITVNFTISTN